MAESNVKKKSKLKKSNDVYRVVILEDDTLREVKSTKFSINQLIWSIAGLILLISGITFCTMAFSPLRNIIPGYADINNNKVYVELSQQIEKLEDDLNAQKVYTDGFKKFLNPTGLKLNQIDQNASEIDNLSNNSTNNRNISNQLSLEHYYFCSPIKGEISSPFDLESNHYGIDIVAPKNTPILNILDGVIINSDWSDKTGNTISVQHKGNLVSIFKHNSVLLKKTGEYVKKGEAIAIIGNTGELTSGPHVHFELWDNGYAINPENFIRFN